MYPSAEPAREVLYLRCILGHTIVGKLKFWDLRRRPDYYASAKQGMPNYGNYFNYIPRFNFDYKLQCLQGFLRRARERFKLYAIFYPVMNVS